MGRWTAADPLVIEVPPGDVGGAYAYAGDSPVMSYDPDGRQSILPNNLRRPQSPHDVKADERGAEVHKKRNVTVAPPPPSKMEVALRNAKVKGAAAQDAMLAKAEHDEALKAKGVDKAALQEIYQAELEAIVAQADSLLDHRYDNVDGFERYETFAEGLILADILRGQVYELTTNADSPTRIVPPEVLEAGVRIGPRVRGRSRNRSGTGQYRDVKGHHVHAKAGFKGHQTYDPKKGFSISEAFMKGKKWSHQKMTNMQRKLFKELEKSGKPNALRAHSRIARKALEAGGATKAEAAALVRQSLVNLRMQMVKNPTRIPWGK